MRASKIAVGLGPRRPFMVRKSFWISPDFYDSKISVGISRLFAPDRMPDRMPEYILEYMSDRKADRILDRISKYISNRILAREWKMEYQI